MIEASRVVEDQTRGYSYAATTGADEAAYLESVLELTKPKDRYSEWHRLIAAPFRYPLPVGPAFRARFKPPFYTRNVLYGAREAETALYEHAYHYLRERVGRKGMVGETNRRTIFSLLVEEPDIVDISGRPDAARICDKNDYSASWEFIRANPEVRVVGYPSCRDPLRRPCLAALEIASLGKEIGEQRAIECYFDPDGRSIRWIDFNLVIGWGEVS